MIFAQLSVTLTAVKKVSAKEEQMAACTLHCVSVSVKPVQEVLALCKFHYCEFHYCGFSKLQEVPAFRDFWCQKGITKFGDHEF